MLRTLGALLLVGVVLGYPKNPTDRIVGGQDADIKDYPYQLALLLFNQQYCGAALITPEFGLTAASCVDHQQLDQLAVRAGSSNKSSGGQVIQVSEVIVHPSYDNRTVNYDVAVLRLAEPVTDENAGTISLPQLGSSAVAGDVAVVSGWGTLEYNGDTPEVLQAVEVPVIDYDVCKLIYGSRLTDVMLCAGDLEGGRDACQGDSGGPLAINGRLAGIVSWGTECARPLFPGVYADVAQVLEWINEQTNQPGPTTTPGPGPETTPGPEPETTTGPGPETTPGPEPETTTGPGPETTPGPEPETTTGPEPETTPGPEPETTTGPEPETTPAPEPETTPGPAPETTTGPEPETTPGPAPETTSAPPPETTPEPAPETTPGPAPETTPAPAPETTPGPEPTSTAEPVIHLQ